MPGTDFSVRNSREVPFFTEQLLSLLTLADKSSRGIKIREDNDFGFMAMQFLYKQMQHAESVLHLIPSRDSGLIARTMIDGLYQLLWAYASPEERGKLWRSFSIIHDWRLMQARIKEGLLVDDTDLRRNEVALREFGGLHRIKNPKPNAEDPYHRYWRGKVTLSQMADLTGRQLYDGPYKDLSDWEHWGVSGIGDSIFRQENHVTVDSISQRVTGLSLWAAFQCLFQTMQIVDECLALKISDKLNQIETEFVQVLNSFNAQ